MATTSATSATTSGEVSPTKWARYALIGLGTIVAAVLANVLVYCLGGALATYDPQFPPLFNASGADIFTIVLVIVAVPLYAILLHFASRPEWTFTIVAAIVLAVSLIPDLTYIPTVPGASGGQTAILIVMHLVAAAVIVGMLTGLVGTRSR